MRANLRGTLWSGLAVSTVIAAIVCSPLAAAQETPAHASLVAWIEATNALSGQALEEWVADNFADSFIQQVPLPQAVTFHQQIQAVGGLTLREIESSTEDSIVARVAGAAGIVLRVQMQVAGSPPKIAGLLVQPAPETEGEPLQWNTLDELAEQLAAEADLPGVALAWARPGEEPKVGSAGLRAAGGDDPVQPDDRFHNGSVTKSITASAIARLVERGELSWNDTLAELLPGIEMRPEYRDVELQELLRHRGGIPEHLTKDDAEMARLNGLPGTPTEQRLAHAAEILTEEPLDRNFHYSNAGYSLAGTIAELASGRSWTELVLEEVFEPLGLDRCGVGWPASEEDPDQPRGHFGAAGARTPQRLDQYPLGAFIDPAGDTHCSAADLARYGLAHLRGLSGEDGFLRADTIAELHRISEAGAPYGAGWGVDPTSGQHRHNGSAGTFFAYLVIDPDAEIVVAFLANAGPPDGQAASRRAVEEILERYAEPR